MAGPIRQAAEKVADQGRDLRATCLQGEVAGVQELNAGVLRVAGEGQRPVRSEGLVVAASDGQQRRLVGAQVLLPARVLRRVGGVVEEEGQLDGVAAGRSTTA
ncbi:hypothetical protein BKM31_13500 [[Actinomadura] parvosata subsp. kistnae]|uniref:Uncharacterized protein n=1 Tax=[Actinomadura] parvosata subsp. kistnae TaxID=1909395 RepID=A0A1U9ZWL0_9ACTN|nr:hypothetical protein BKM31_13500 [Nonomuraea sp. ATCC 55076]